VGELSDRTWHVFVKPLLNSDQPCTGGNILGGGLSMSARLHPLRQSSAIECAADAERLLVIARVLQNPQFERPGHIQEYDSLWLYALGGSGVHEDFKGVPRAVHFSFCPGTCDTPHEAQLVEQQGLYLMNPGSTRQECVTYEYIGARARYRALRFPSQLGVAITFLYPHPHCHFFLIVAEMVCLSKAHAAMRLRYPNAFLKVCDGHSEMFFLEETEVAVYFAAEYERAAVELGFVVHFPNDCRRRVQVVV